MNRIAACIFAALLAALPAAAQETYPCGFRGKSATDSDLKSAAASDLKPATFSDGSRPPIPI